MERREQKHNIQTPCNINSVTALFTINVQLIGKLTMRHFAFDYTVVPEKHVTVKTSMVCVAEPKQCNADAIARKGPMNEKA